MLKKYKGNIPKAHHTSYISEKSILIGKVFLGRYTSVWPGCVLRADICDIIVNDNSNIQDGVLIHTNYDKPVVIGHGVTVGHGAILHGCIIGDNCLIGMGAIILDGARIGENSIIGAGALVCENTAIKSNSLVLGVPGKVARQLNKSDIERIKHSALEYRKLSGIYRRAQ